MEKIVFQKSGQLDNFIEWLDRFTGDISKDSLIIEVDPSTKYFIAKTYADDKSFVRYSQITFEDAGFSIKEQSENSGQRILIGIFKILSKFVDTVKTFDTSETFTMSIDYDVMSVAGKDKWCSKTVVFKSKSLKMKVPGSSITAVEMNPLSDELFFNVVWIAPDPITITISPDIIKNILSISEIFLKKEKTENLMEFYTKDTDEGKKMFIREPDGSYDYELGKVNEGSSDGNVTVPVYREKFLLSVKNAIDETTIMISTDPQKCTRVCIELKGGNTKTIIARVNR